MTEDKDFKELVRRQAKSTGRRYTAVRAEMRPPAGTQPGTVAEGFESIVETIDSWVHAENDLSRLVATALLVPGNVLVRGAPGNGMTALGQGVAAAIGGRLVSIDGRDGLDPAAPGRWRSDDVVVIGHFDGLEPAAQVAVVTAGRLPAIVLAKRHPIRDRMPHPPDDDTLERFLLSVDLDYGDADTLLRIVAENRDGPSRARRDPAVDQGWLAAARAMLPSVIVPDDVRRFAVDAVTAIREDTEVLLGGSVIATLALIDGAAAVALSEGRGTVTTDDVGRILQPVLAHRIVYRDESTADFDALIERIGAETG